MSEELNQTAKSPAEELKEVVLRTLFIYFGVDTRATPIQIERLCGKDSLGNLVYTLDEIEHALDYLVEDDLANVERIDESDIVPGMWHAEFSPAKATYGVSKEYFESQIKKPNRGTLPRRFIVNMGKLRPDADFRLMNNDEFYNRDVNLLWEGFKLGHDLAVKQQPGLHFIGKVTPEGIQISPKAKAYHNEGDLAHAMKRCRKVYGGEYISFSIPRNFCNYLWGRFNDNPNPSFVIKDRDIESIAFVTGKVKEVEYVDMRKKLHPIPSKMDPARKEWLAMKIEFLKKQLAEFEAEAAQTEEKE